MMLVALSKPYFKFDDYAGVVDLPILDAPIMGRGVISLLNLRLRLLSVYNTCHTYPMSALPTYPGTIKPMLTITRALW